MTDNRFIEWIMKRGSLHTVDQLHATDRRQINLPVMKRHRSDDNFAGIVSLIPRVFPYCRIITGSVYYRILRAFSLCTVFNYMPMFRQLYATSYTVLAVVQTQSTCVLACIQV